MQTQQLPPCTPISLAPQKPPFPHLYRTTAGVPPSTPTARPPLSDHKTARFDAGDGGAHAGRGLNRGSSLVPGQVVAPGGSMRRELLLPAESPARRRVAEVAGGTAAECAAVCCCCPCGVVGLLLAALVKLPAAVYRRVVNRRRRRLRAKRAAAVPVQVLPAVEEDAVAMWSPEKSPSAIISAMEEEMWERFFNAGFWRIPSEREREDDAYCFGLDHELYCVPISPKK